MPSNPFTDAFAFLIGTTGDYNALGAWKWPLVALFAALLVASVVIAVRNWREDPEQRTVAHLATWIMRVLIGSMWFQGMLWKLPLFRPNGLLYWMEQMAGRGAFQIHRDLVTNIIIPNFNLFNPLVFLAELTFATCLILGFGVRIVSVLAILFGLNLWLGIYLDRGPGDPDEWPWSYLFLIMVHVFFAVHGAGRSLGLDALLRRRTGDPYAYPSGIGRLHRAVS
jgi:uncharacterized membrane protein YphA (DoxX/SURF4 family)